VEALAFLARPPAQLGHRPPKRLLHNTEGDPARAPN
jgi:hypothetical protein